MVMKISDLEVTYGQEKVLDIHRTIEIHNGDRIGVIGSNGAGKSTFIKSLLGIVNYTGKIESQISPEDMAVHLQFNEYTSAMPIKYVMEAILQTSIDKNQKLQELITYFDFEKCLNKKYKNLSGGQQQRFTIILVMMQDAPLTFYDEVTSGLDFETRQKLVEKLKQWYENKKTSLCIVSHYYEELEQLTNKLLILDHGKVIAFGEKESLFEQYCGKAIIIVENNEKNQKITKDLKKIKAPQHLICLSCDTLVTESEISRLLLEHNVNYKRSNNDIEMIFINAKEQAINGGKENEEK